MATKKAKAKRKSARDLKNLDTLPENSEEGLRSRRGTAAVMYLSMGIQLKSCHIFPFPKRCHTFT